MRAQCLAPWRRVRPRGSVPAHRWRGERVLHQRCGVRGAEAACRALGPVEIRRHEVLDEAVAMIACMRACSGQGRVLVGGSPNLPLQDACLRVCGGRAVAATARFTETLPQLPAKKRHSCRMHALVCVGAMACALARRPLGSALPLAQQCSAQHAHGRTACMDAHIGWRIGAT